MSFVLMTDILGGGERFTVDLACALRSWANVTVVSRPGSPLIEFAHQRGLNVAEVDLGAKLGRRTALSNSRRWFSAQRRLFDLCQAGLTRSDWCVLQYKWEELLWAGRQVPSRVLLMEHGPIPGALLRLPFTRRRLRAAFTRADAVVAVSEPARVSIQALTGRQAQRIDAGIDLEVVSEALGGRLTRRSELLGPDGSNRLLIAYAGRLAHDKGVRHVIDALPLMPEGVLVVAGDGPARASLSAHASSIGVADRVRFLGYVDRPLDLIAAADVCVLLSSSPGEGRPLGAIEANAVGTPVIGAAWSPALAALAAEDRVQLVRDATPASLRRIITAAATKPRRTISADGWAGAAGEFAAAMSLGKAGR